MKQLLRLSFLLLFTINFTIILYSQDWKKENINPHADSLLAVYSWSAGNQYHTAWGKLFLFKNKRYKYSSFYPFADEEYSEGNYKFRKDTLILNSDFQPNKVQVKVNYLDTSITDTAFKKINFIKNKNGKLIYNGYYLLNNDTTLNGWYDPGLPFNKNLLNSIHSLKVLFNYNDFSSAWIPILTNDKFIEVVILSDKDFDNYRNKVFTNYKFRMNKKMLVELDMRK